MSGIIPKESLGGFQRWQVGDFNPRPTTAPAATPVIAETPENADSGLVVNDVPLPTAEDIEQIHEQARAEGYQAGYAEGQQAARQAIVQGHQFILGPLCTEATQISQIAVANIGKAKACFSTSIQRPGFGSRRRRPGAKESATTGRAKPSASAMKTERATAGA